MSVQKIDEESDQPPAPDAAWFPGTMRCGVTDNVLGTDTQWIYLELGRLELYTQDPEPEGELPPGYVLPIVLPENIAIDVVELLALTLKRAGSLETQQTLSDLLARLAL